MRYSPEHKEAVRAQIVEAASRALRENGIDGVGIPAVMKAAGLTHGGFYAHFADRDELVSEAARAAAEETALRVFAPAESAAEMVKAYASAEHAAHPAYGCVLAALGTEAPRQKAGVRRVFAELARGFLGHVDRKLRPRGRGNVSDEALALASQMVGAVVLARLVEDAELRDRLLSVTQRQPSR